MILDEIVMRTRARVSALVIQDELPALPYKKQSLIEAIGSAEDRNAIIAELKYASPSKGRIRTGPEPSQLAREFSRGGCVAISVLTEPDFFKGSLDFIGEVRNHVELPVLRKDFVIDEKQLYETRNSGANAILLIAGLLEERLCEFTELATGLGLEPLIEIHSERELDLALRTDGMLIGINNRDLATMKVDIGKTIRLAGPVHDAGRLVVSESGIGTVGDIMRLKGTADAFLIGTAIMSAEDPKNRLEEFVFA